MMKGETMADETNTLSDLEKAKWIVYRLEDEIGSGSTSLRKALAMAFFEGTIGEREPATFGNLLAWADRKMRCPFHGLANSNETTPCCLNAMARSD